MLNPSVLKALPAQPVEDWTVFGSPNDWQAIPPELRSQIAFLDSGSTQAAYAAFSQADLLCGDDGWGNRPFSAGCF